MSGVAAAELACHPVALTLMVALVAIVVAVLMANAADWFRRRRP